MPNMIRPFHGSTGKDTLPLRLMLVVNCRTPGPKAIQSVASAQEVTGSAARTRRRRPPPGGVSITAPPKANTAPAPAPAMASEDHPLAESRRNVIALTAKRPTPRRQQAVPIAYRPPGESSVLLVPKLTSFLKVRYRVRAP
jgi:hypothetical protein